MSAKIAIVLSSIAVISIGTILFYIFISAHCLFGGDYYHEPSTPLHDAVVLYYQDKKSEAKRLLLKAAHDKKYTGGAYINYAMFLEKEGEYTEAEEYYRKALQSGEHVALLYLFAMYEKRKVESPRSAIVAAANLSHAYGACWVELRNAEEKLLKNDAEGAMKSLEKAVELGLPALPIFYIDPLYRPIKENSQFQALMTKARANYRNYQYIEKKMEDEFLQYCKDSPYGMMKNLYKILTDEKANDVTTEKALVELLHTEASTRDKGIALYRLARIRARNKDKNGAIKYLDKFKDLIASDKSDRTGFVAVVKRIGDDLYSNDPLLKNLK